jgi:hypothetical protein
MADYQDKTKEELLEEARERDLKGRSSMDKDELVRALEEDDSNDPPTSDESSSESTDSGASTEHQEGNASVEGEAPAASNEGEGEGEPRGADSDVEHYGFMSEASDENNPDVVEELSPEEQEALDEMGEQQAKFADLALAASGPNILQSPSERIMTGAVSEEHAKELSGLLKDLPEDHVGHVTESGEFAEPRRGSGPDGQIMPEDVIDFPPPLQVDEEDRRASAAGKKASVVDVNTVQSDHARAAFPEDDASGQDRAFNQRAQLYTDGLSGEAGHNLPLSYRVNEVGTGVAETDEAQQEELAREEQSREGTKEALQQNEDEE